MNTPGMLVAILVLGAGTFAFRFAGPVLRERLTLSVYADRLIAVAVVVLLSALFATATITEGESFAGYARPAGVLVGGVLAWRKAPFVATVVAAAATAAGLRLLGVP
ncbi:AzlD domain-containing protein [Solicola gregarius]|uniref:AzlD domain-containing protein n=1 Tax=Solicola gregarius TaxID=2908642 RepID=A0AA46THJ3_9ACTN|nr:AzlD domain-containing protein [Solicola gregarius]UYM05255.1 AzlD domain-containing protein [Solicola gregarius]